jgi:hypothetical protein
MHAEQLQASQSQNAAAALRFGVGNVVAQEFTNKIRIARHPGCQHAMRLVGGRTTMTRS